MNRGVDLFSDGRCRGDVLDGVLDDSSAGSVFSFIDGRSKTQVP